MYELSSEHVIAELKWKVPHVLVEVGSFSTQDSFVVCMSHIVCKEFISPKKSFVVL